MDSRASLLEIKDLSVAFRSLSGDQQAVNEFNLSVSEGETVALVGESGSGKSVTCLSVMGLLPPTGYVSNGSILLGGNNVLEMDEASRRKLRGTEMAMVFQEPMTSLNPVFKIGSQISESVRYHDSLSKSDARKRAKELLDLVRIPEAEKRLENYPHEMSGGMRQRVMIAMALAGNPKLLIADEPTTALDVTVQAQILDLLAELQSEMGMALLFVTHDLGVVADIADKVCVMYAGQMVEYGMVQDVFARPLMPYTSGLIQSVPTLKGDGERSRLYTISGQSPTPGEMRTGCAFGPRCEFALDSCLEVSIEVQEIEGHLVRCARATELASL